MAVEVLTLRVEAERGDGRNLFMRFYPTNTGLDGVAWHGCETEMATNETADEAVARCMPAARTCLLAAVQAKYPGEYV